MTQREAFEAWSVEWMGAHNSEHPSAWDGWQASAARYEGKLKALSIELSDLRDAAAAYLYSFEAQADCQECDDLAEARGGRCDPHCDACMQRWATTADALEDVLIVDDETIFGPKRGKQ